MNEFNGKSLQVLESIKVLGEEAAQTLPKSKQKPKKEGSAVKNKMVCAKLDIDAGAKRVKCRLNGLLKSFPSEAKETKSEVPLRNDGCFAYRNKQYVVGSAIDRVNGSVIVGSQDNKISHLDVWILGALTHYRTFLKSAVDSRTRKQQPVQLALDLRIVTLSSPQRKELNKALSAIEKFIWDDVEFNVTVKSCEFIDEGEGAALEIINLHQLQRFHLIDLGGGTLTFTTYEWDGVEITTTAKTPVSGGGMTSIINRVFKALTRTDRGAIQAESSAIQLALEGSQKRGENWYVPLRSSGKFTNISDEVEGALSEWVQGNWAIQNLFDLISQKLARGEQVFCSGGGFAVKIVADWIIQYLLNDVPDNKITVLENPQDINLAGLRWLDTASEKTI